MTPLEIADSESTLSFDFWPMDYKEEWPEEGAAKVYVEVTMPEPDVGIPFSLRCNFFIGETEYTEQLSRQAHKEMLKQALDEFNKWWKEALVP